tara:strand:- start:814 stop:1062 length:249 start_codon:yes stop_codon:yes gene_type:complete
MSKTKIFLNTTDLNNPTIEITENKTNYRTCKKYDERQKKTMLLTQKLYKSLFTSYNERNLKLAKDTLEELNQVINEELKNNI